MTNRTRILLERKIRQIVRQQLSEASGINEDNVEEYILHAESTYRLYDVLHNTYVPALMKFKKRGTFDREKALKLLEYYYQNYVRPSYKKRLGVDYKLNPAERKMFSNHFLTTLEEEGHLDMD